MKHLFCILALITLSQANALVITSHKTAGLEYPENTLEGFKHSLNLSVDAIELDLHFTKDKQIVLSHDPVLDEYNCFKKKQEKVIIAQSTYKKIQSVNCYNKKLKSYYKLPHINEILSAYNNSNRKDIELNIEIKVLDKLIENWDRYQGIEHQDLHLPETEMAQLTLSKLREYNISQKVLFSTFSPELLLVLKSLQNTDENFRYGLLFKGTYSPKLLGWLAKIMKLTCYDNCWFPYWKKAKKWMIKNKIDVFIPNWPQLIHPLYKRGFKKHFQNQNLPFEVYPWTLNSDKDWKLFEDEYQFDGIITDLPSDYLNSLKK